MNDSTDHDAGHRSSPRAIRVRRRLRRAPVRAALLAGLACSGACVGERAPIGADGEAPDSFVVAFETSRGEVRIAFHRAWCPIAVARVWALASGDHWAGARLYRVNPRYAQFGYTGRPEVDSVWVGAGIPDEPVVASNERGTVSFARGGPGTRSVLLFINRTDNSNLDEIAWRGVQGFPPVGRVVSGMEAADALEGAYGDAPLEWEDSIVSQGNRFLDRRYPGLDSILRVEIVEDWR